MRLLIGTYSEPIVFGTGERFCGKGKGLYCCDYDGETIAVRHLLPLGNPSFFAVNPAAGRVYAVNEMKEFQGQYGGGLTEVALAPDGSMQALRSLPTMGTDPCHAALSPDGRQVGVANFADGSVTFFPLDADGSLTGEAQHIQHAGSGPHPVRQRGPHAHSVIYDDAGRAYVPDLGIDSVVCYDVQGGKAAPDAAHTVAVAPGSGPRFGVFSRDHRRFYLICELGSQVMHFDVQDGTMTLRQTCPTLPEDFAGNNICSDLHLTPDGRFLYASNRGHDSLAAFAVAEDGALTFIGRAPCHGRTPRNFAIAPDGKTLLVGNQDSDTISLYAIDADGQLTFRRNVDFPTPVCIQFLPE